ncbi:MAG TPA: methyltransferase domain-containing protein [Pyrinomonadaceae bacterium]|nr:methyltransferase domain-containing protein [Pyrinomonadaceae bacterium]
MSTELDVERLMHEIRQNVARQHNAVEHPAASPPQPSNGLHPPDGLRLQPAFQTKTNNRYHVNDLLQFHGEEFVRNAYQALLMREPDAAGLNYHVQSLTSGRFNKIDVLASLHNSPEGRRSPVTITGLLVPTTIRRLGRIPVIGYLIRMLMAILRLPAAIQNQSQFEQYALSVQQRIVDHQTQRDRDLSHALAQLTMELRATAQELAQQQQTVESSLLRQHGELVTRHDELVKTIEARFDEARRYVDDLTARITTQFAAQVQELRDRQQILGDQQLAISRRQDVEKVELQNSHHQFTSDLIEQATRQQQLRAEFDEHRTRQQALRSEIDDQLQQHLLRQQRAHDELAAQEARLRNLLEGVTTPTSSFVQLAAEETDHLLDGFYASFEDQFRGPRDEVKQRLQVYIPILKEAKIAGDVLDVGCGRGEWLQLLEGEGIKAEGVDRNRVFVEECRRSGLTVTEADALTHLRGLPSESLNAVTSFHLVEHLPFETLIELLDEMVRTIRRGGLLILETPNPENLLVGGCNFYADPTHRHPIPSQTLQFLLESRGFHDIRILKLRPWDEAKIEGDSEIIKRFNEMFYSAPDYGIIANRT